MGKLLGQRVAILVDGQSIYLSSKARSANPDYKAIISAVNGREISQGDCLLLI